MPTRDRENRPLMLSLSRQFMLRPLAVTVRRRARPPLVTVLCLLAIACAPAPVAPQVDVPTTPPAQAVAQLVRDLRRDDLEAYARHAVPPALYERLKVAWRENRTVWPLTELPLDDRLPSMITALAAPNAEQALMKTFQRQFAGEQGELRSAAKTLGLFAVKYIRDEDAYSLEERDHFVQLVGAMGGWAQRAPLADSKRAQAALPQLVSAARLTGLSAPGAFAEAGMERSLRRLGPFSERFKRVTAQYGLDLNEALDSVKATLTQQIGDTAEVRVRYVLAGKPIDALVAVERMDGGWYLTDAVRRAEAEANRGLPDAPPPAPTDTPAAPRKDAPAPAAAATPPPA